MIESWAIFSFLAAILWGLSYTLDEKILHSGVSPAFLMFIMAIIFLPLYALILIKSGTWRGSLAAVGQNHSLLVLIVLSALTIGAGNIMITSAIAAKNSSIASIIEISYPIFVVLFSWLIFRQIHINWQTCLGAALIFTGSAIVYLKAGH